MTCLILTRNRRRWLPFALRCAEYQTYPHKEILVVSSGETVTDLLPTGARNLHLPGKPLIGTLRNRGCAAANGDVIAHFDDDDWSHPERLADQVKRLVESSKSVTGYRTMRFTDGRKWWMYRGSPDYAVGTSLVYWRSYWAANPFRELQIGEDNEYVGRARMQRQIVVADDDHLMFATIHPSNTSPRTTAKWKEL